MVNEPIGALIITMKIEVGDLIFCHAVGSKYGWYLNQVGLIANKTKDDFDIYLNCGRWEIIRQKDVEEGKIEIISKANGQKVKLDKSLQKIPNFEKMVGDIAAKSN